MDHWFTWLFFIALICKESFDFLLDYLNSKHVLKNKDHIPKPYQGVIDTPTYEKSVAYTLEKLKFGQISQTYMLVILLLFIGTGFFDKLDAFLQSTISWSQIHHAVIYCLVIGLVLSLVQLPASLYSTFGIEQKFGFNRMTWKLYLLDMLKSLLLSLSLGVPLLYLVFWFFDIAGPYWWVWTFSALFLFQFFLAAVYPTFLAPLFNKFTPLEDSSLKDSIEEIAKKIHFKMSGIFTIDGSKRSTHSNAYFAGMGRFRRIVLFDTIRETLSDREIIAVLAHEMGHNKKRHIQKMMLVSLVTTFVGFWVLSLLVDWPPFFTTFNAGRPTIYKALVLFALFSGYFTFYMTAVMNYFSRKNEFEADQFSVEVVGDKEAMASSLLKLSKENLSNLTPHPLYSFYHYSHPTTMERIKAIEATV